MAELGCLASTPLQKYISDVFRITLDHTQLSHTYNFHNTSIELNAGGAEFSLCTFSAHAQFCSDAGEGLLEENIFTLLSHKVCVLLYVTEKLKTLLYTLQ